MTIGSGGTAWASLMLAVALGSSAAMAQTSAGGTWTDPPARGPAPAAPPSSPSSAETSTAPQSVSTPAPVSVGKAAEAPVHAGKPDVVTAPVVRQASTSLRHRAHEAKSIRVVKPVREARRSRSQFVAEVPQHRLHAHAGQIRVAEPRETFRSVPRRVATNTFAPRAGAAQPYPYGPLPVGRVLGPTDGERNPVFEEGDDRTRRIAAAQAAGYLVVRSRTVQYPDGRTVRSYRPYDDDDGFD